jgi:DNA-binding transcriptional regulator LsrR (DeoR family)
MLAEESSRHAKKFMIRDETRTTGERSQAELGLATRAAWLSYVGGYTQEDIAVRLGVSRVKVNRLIALAQREGLVRVFVEGTAAECVALEDRIAAAYGLDFCTVAPDLGEAELPLATLAAAGAHFLLTVLERPGLKVVGIGHGRTLAAVVDRLPRLPRVDLKFVSLLGSLTRSAAANPFDVIHRLAGKVGGESYFLPVPFFADSVEDKAVLAAQRSVKHVFELARQADLVVVGIGELSADAHLLETGMITRAELAELEQAGAEGEVLGHFFDAGGRSVEADVNRRALGLTPDDLRGKEVVAIAGGRGKAWAIAAVLESGLLTGLVTDEATARRLVERRLDLQPQTVRPPAERSAIAKMAS